MKLLEILLTNTPLSYLCFSGGHLLISAPTENWKNFHWWRVIPWKIWKPLINSKFKAYTFKQILLKVSLNLLNSKSWQNRTITHHISRVEKIVAPFITLLLTPSEQKLVNYSLHNPLNFFKNRFLFKLTNTCLKCVKRRKRTGFMILSKILYVQK